MRRKRVLRGDYGTRQFIIFSVDPDHVSVNDVAPLQVTRCMRGSVLWKSYGTPSEDVGSVNHGRSIRNRISETARIYSTWPVYSPELALLPTDWLVTANQALTQSLPRPLPLNLLR